MSCPIIHIPYAIPQEKQQPFNKKNYILWIARCAPIKNPLAFITIAAAFPTQQFVMIAAPQEGHMELFDAIKKAAGVHSNITLIPGVPNESAQRYFNEAVVSVNTSSSEGFPFAFLESGLGKTPIMSLTVNPDNLITTHNIGYCANGDIDLLIQQLQTILSNSDDLREKSNAAREYVRKYHDIRHTSQLWKDVLSSSLLGSDMK
ncbi:MAG TPA: glycosyltransferase [Candidatus Andersenbacteria bacterium]|nr:glycosyltransferase [Candidatus Andersenbacteria bacterium]